MKRGSKIPENNSECRDTHFVSNHAPCCVKHRYVHRWLLVYLANDWCPCASVGAGSELGKWTSWRGCTRPITWLWGDEWT